MERTYSLRRRAPPPAKVLAAESPSLQLAKPSKRAKKSVSASVAARPVPQGVYVSSDIGARPYMEDAYGVHLDGKSLVIGIFDGHGGEQCSFFCSERLCQEVADHPSLQADPYKAIHDIFSKIDKEFCDKYGETGAGSTATVAVLQPGANGYKLSLGFVGDSSAILIRSDDSYEMLTTNHHGSREDERARIEKLGGSVTFDTQDNVYRVEGVLAVTRAVGDSYLKPYVSSAPEHKEVNVGHNDLLVIGSDGLWDEVEPKTMVETIRKFGTKSGLSQLVKMAAKVGDDNVCAIVLEVGTAITLHFPSKSSSTSTPASLT